MNIQSHDILAKLLATENINIVRGRVSTASFDIKNRVLVLPQWKNMTSELEQMLIGHEVGHALFTSREKYGKVFEKQNRHLRGYANVIEDARIEARMKERYPGLRKTFLQGYQTLRDRDFFEIKNRDLNEMILIDRINLYFKLGFNCGVTFTPEEKEYVDRVERCKTEEEVLELSAEIYKFSKEQKERSMGDLGFAEGEEEEDDQAERVFGESDEDPTDIDAGDASDESDRPYYGDVEDGVDPELQPETLDALESNLANSTDTSLKVEYFEPEFEFSVQGNDVIVPYARVISELKGSIESEQLLSSSKVKKFKASSSPIVNYLIKEFEMKKSATAYKRAKIAKTGNINVNKLYAYKMKDDIFKQVLTVKDGKKHGMVFLLDWSGSMSNNIAETVEQVINLAMFCQRAQIPYQVFAFTDGYIDESYDRYGIGGYKCKNANGFGSDGTFKLLEFFSSKMTNSEFNIMISLLLNRAWRFPNYGLNGTPLNEATLYMVSHLQKFKEQFQVEKLSLITLTDGEGSALGHSSRKTLDGIVYEQNYTRIRIKSILRDPITKKEYLMGEDSNSQVSAIRSLIRDRLDCKLVGFYIISNNVRETDRFVKNNMRIEDVNERRNMAEKIQRSIRSSKYYVAKMPSYDEFYLLSALKIQEHDIDEVNSDMTAASISNKLTKMMNSRKMSRVVLDKFISQVS